MPAFKTAIKTFNKPLSHLLEHLRNPLHVNAYALSASFVVSGLFGVVFWIVAARYFDTSDIGRNSALISTMLLLSGFSQLNLTGVLPRYIPIAGSSTKKLINGSYMASSFAAMLAAGVFILGSHLWGIDQNTLGETTQFRLWFVVSVAIWGLIVLQDGVLAGLRRTIWIPVKTTLFSISKVVLLLLFARFLPLNGIYLAWTVPILAFLIPVHFFMFQSLIPQHIAKTGAESPSGLFRQILEYATGDYIGSLFVLAIQYLLPVMVVARLGVEENAYFYIAWMLGLAMENIPWSMSTSLLVEGSTNQAELTNYVRQTLINMARLLTPMVVLVFLAAPLILSIFGKEYAENAAGLLRLLALSIIPKSLAAVYLSMIHIEGKIFLFTIIPIALCISILVSSYIFLPVYGNQAIGYAVLISYSILASITTGVGLLPKFLRRQ